MSDSKSFIIAATGEMRITSDDYRPTLMIYNGQAQWPNFVSVMPPSAPAIPFVIRLAPAQTADMWQLQDPAGSVKAAWRVDGTFWVADDMATDEAARQFVETVGRLLGLVGRSEMEAQ